MKTGLKKIGKQTFFQNLLKKVQKQKVVRHKLAEKGKISKDEFELFLESHNLIFIKNGNEYTITNRELSLEELHC